MWSMGSNSNNHQSYNDQNEQQQRVAAAAAAAAQMAHRISSDNQQSMLYEGATVPDFYNPYQQLSIPSGLHQAFEERRRMELTMEARAQQMRQFDQLDRHGHQRRSQVQQQVYDQDVVALASSAASDDSQERVRRNVLAQEISGDDARAPMNSERHGGGRDRKRRKNGTANSSSSIPPNSSAENSPFMTMMAEANALDKHDHHMESDNHSDGSASPLPSPESNTKSNVVSKFVEKSHSHNHQDDDEQDAEQDTPVRETSENNAALIYDVVKSPESTSSRPGSTEQDSLANLDEQTTNNEDDIPQNVVDAKVVSTPKVKSSASTTKSRKRKEPSTSKTPTAASKKRKTKSTPASSKSKTSPTKKPRATPKKTQTSTIELNSGSQPNLNQSVPSITPEEYANLDELMAQFCKVPLLAEFSRPVSLLHPELIPLYSKVVKDPIDLGKVCRAIRRRQYTNTRQVCIDTWRIFANCVKYHTHPLTREGAIPSFVSIANHLRDYFNALWMEYMIPSEISSSKKDAVSVSIRNADDKRKKMRKERYNVLLSTLLSTTCVENSANAIEKFVEMGGRVDHLDKEKVVNVSGDEDGDIAIKNVFHALSQMAKQLKRMVQEDEEVEYAVEALGIDLKRCIGPEVFEGMPWLRVKLEKRLDRLLGKILSPINEATCRGVNQSSVWGCMAAAIWARETTKRPYWPAIVLGILAPEDQKEDWHVFLTERNEARLPEKLHQGLQAGKKKAQQALNRQNDGKAERMSFFLVEFLGTHEFIWVREADIIENFNPDKDPNQQQAAAGNITKKKKSSLRGQTPANAKMLQKAIDEGRWALEEFEMQLNDPCGDQLEEYADDEEEENYTFSVLCETDDEADEADGGMGDSDDIGDMNHFGSPTGRLDDVEEINELLATDGVLDYSTAGRKNAKKRAAALKKQQVDAKKLALKKEKEEKAKEEKAKKAKAASKKSKSDSKGAKESKQKASSAEADAKKEQKELEKRRRKRERERERMIKEEERKSKKIKTEGNSVIRRGRKLGIVDKRGRAAAIVRGYLNRMAATADLKGLGLSGVLTIPAASVEGTGLLGMALAFRAAAGELEMPNTNDNPPSFKPWENIDADAPLKSEDRCSKLEKQIELIKNELEKLEKNDIRRRELISDAKKEKEEKDAAMKQSEKEARQNDMPKRKPVAKKKEASPKQSDSKDDNTEKEGDVTDQKNNGDTVVDVEIQEDGDNEANEFLGEAEA